MCFLFISHVFVCRLGGLVKDLTKRYASDYLPQMRKLRIDPDWWQDTLKCYGPKTAADRDKDKAEETQLEGVYAVTLLLAADVSTLFPGIKIWR